MANMTNKGGIAHTQDHDLTHSMVHYLLTIHKLREKKGYARVTDIAKELGVTKGSVSTALNNLKKRELVIEDDSKFLSLSKNGHDEVHSILSSRTLLFYFLKDILGVTEETAAQDSCLMEHLVGEETRDRLFQFMKNYSEKNGNNLSINLQDFEHSNEFVKAQMGDSHLE